MDKAIFVNAEISLNIAVAIVGLQNPLHIMVSLRTVAITVFGKGIAVIAGFILMAQIEIDIPFPNLGIFAVLSRQANGIQHMAGTCIIRGKHKFNPGNNP